MEDVATGAAVAVEVTIMVVMLEFASSWSLRQDVIFLLVQDLGSFYLKIDKRWKGDFPRHFVSMDQRHWYFKRVHIQTWRWWLDLVSCFPASAYTVQPIPNVSGKRMVRTAQEYEKAA
jgi:hypothetical protein